jgi:mannose-6-phosphate isomerase-like protein (cupin superfamily)
MTYANYRSTAPFEFQGLVIRELTPATLSSASIAEVCVPAGCGHGRARSRRCDKLYVCVKGEVAFNLDDVLFHLVPYDTVAVPCGSWFSYLNRQSEEARLLLLHVPPFDLEAEEFREK